MTRSKTSLRFILAITTLACFSSVSHGQNTPDTLHTETLQPAPDSIPAVQKTVRDSIAAPIAETAAPGPLEKADSLTVFPEIDSQLFTAGQIVDTTKALVTDTLDLAKKEPARRDTLIEVEHAIRFGIDLAAPVLPLISGKNNDNGWMVMADYRLRPKLYGALDFGHAKRGLNFTSMRTDVDGWYARAGIYYALIQNMLSPGDKKGDSDMLFTGIKIGYSKYNRHIYDSSVQGGYWGNDYSIDIKDNPSAMWLDLSIGIMVRLFKSNFYLSMQGGYDVILSSSDNSGIGALVVPGLGQVYNKSTAFSFSYALSYRIPLYKRIHKVRIKQKRETENERRLKELEAKKKEPMTPAFTPSELLEE